MIIGVQLEEGAFPPIRAHADDAGADIKTPERIVIHPHDRKIIDTGIHMAIPLGYCGQLFSKSGLMAKGIVCAGGTIDSSYRGTIKVVMENHTGAPYIFERGDKITQIVVIPCLLAEFKPVLTLDDEFTDRGEKGFGSTGK